MTDISTIVPLMSDDSDISFRSPRKNFKVMCFTSGFTQVFSPEGIHKHFNFFNPGKK